MDTTNTTTTAGREAEKTNVDCAGCARSVASISATDGNRTMVRTCRRCGERYEYAVAIRVFRSPGRVITVTSQTATYLGVLRPATTRLLGRAMNASDIGTTVFVPRCYETQAGRPKETR